MTPTRAQQVMTQLDAAIQTFKSLSDICDKEEFEKVRQIWAETPVTSSVYDVLQTLASGE